jgi:hypothetical protein
MTKNAPRKPLKSSEDAPDCDMRLPVKALAYRNEKGWLSITAFSKYNITVWLLDLDGTPEFIIKENVPIDELKARFGPAIHPKAEVGFHSEMLARDELEKRKEFCQRKTSGSTDLHGTHTVSGDVQANATSES